METPDFYQYSSSPSLLPIKKGWNSDNYLFAPLKSHNKMEQSIGDISLSSRMCHRKQNTNTSTNQTSKGQDHQSTLPNEDEDSIQRPDKLKQLQNRIASVQQSQSQLQGKFEKVLESLNREVAKKDEANAMLEAEISFLRGQLEEGRKDLGIIVNYLNKKKAKASEGQTRRVLLDSTKGSGKLGKSISGSKKDIDLTVLGPKEQKKNGSPRMLVLKRSYKG